MGTRELASSNEKSFFKDMKIYFDLFVIHRTTFSLYKFETTYPVFPLVWENPPEQVAEKLPKRHPRGAPSASLRTGSGDEGSQSSLKSKRRESLLILRMTCLIVFQQPAKDRIHQTKTQSPFF